MGLKSLMFRVLRSVFRVMRLSDLKMSKQLFLQNTEHGTLNVKRFKFRLAVLF